MSSHLSFSTFVTSTRDELEEALSEEFEKGVRVRYLDLPMMDTVVEPSAKSRPVCLQDYRTAFCINCGANDDVGKLLSSLGEEAKQFVRLVFIDSNRPIHHSLNDDNDNSCVLLHDPDCGDVPLDCIPVSDAAVDENTGILCMLTVAQV